MKIKLLELMMSNALGFFTGVLLSGNGIHLYESGIHILLGCILWNLIFLYLKLPGKKEVEQRNGRQ